MFVVPAPYRVRGELQRESRLRSCEDRELLRTWIPAFAGMTEILFGL